MNILSTKIFKHGALRRELVVRLTRQRELIELSSCRARFFMQQLVGLVIRAKLRRIGVCRLPSKGGEHEISREVFFEKQHERLTEKPWDNLEIRNLFLDCSSYVPYTD